MSNMVVRTNIFSLNAHRNMKNVGLEQKRASNRLSSGYRINSAADDAAGLAISETMRAQIRGLDQASRNAQDGQAMLLTTEGGLEEIGNMLQRVRELLVQASNDTNTQDQRTMIEQEIAQLSQEIGSMQQRVEFNTNRVLAMGPAMVGSVANQASLVQKDMNVLSDAFAQVNENLRNVATAREMLAAMPPDQIYKNLNAMQKESVDNALEGVGFGTTSAGVFQSAGMETAELLSSDALAGVAAATVTDGMSRDALIALLDARTIALNNVATELNEHIGRIQVNSRAIFTDIATFVAFGEVGSVGGTAGSAAKAAEPGYWVFDPAQLPVNASNHIDTAPMAGNANNFFGMTEARINELIQEAVDDTNSGAKDGTTTFEYGGQTWTIEAKEDAYGVSIAEAIAAGDITFTSATRAALTAGAGFYADKAAFDKAVADGTATWADDEGGREIAFIVGEGWVEFNRAEYDETVANQAPPATMKQDGSGGWIYYGGDKDGEAVATDEPDSTAVAAPPANPINEDDPNATGSGLAVGADGTVHGTWIWVAATEAVDEVEAVDASPELAAGSSGNSIAWFQVGANSNQGIQFDFETVSRVVTGAASTVSMVATLISNPAQGTGIGRGVSVTPLINQIQASLDNVSTVRANLGAVQNRLDYTMRSLDISSENLQDSESRVRNADIAREMMRFTMANVLQQASVSMLSQANQMPNNLLQLLR